MSDARLARALLRLYPLNWRERYGDEFLALVDQSALTWRTVADVMSAAGLERARTALALAFADIDPQLGQHTSSGQMAAGLADLAGLATVVGATVLTFGAAGVAYPGWMFWYWIGNVWHTRGLPVTVGDWLDRLLASSFWFFVAVALTGASWLTAEALHQLGAAAPSDRLLNWLFGIVLLCAVLRGVYWLVRMMPFGSQCRGVAQREVSTWNGLLFVLFVMTFLNDPSSKVFWPFAGFFWLSIRLPFSFTHAGALKRQQHHDAIFGKEALSKFPRY